MWCSTHVIVIYYYVRLRFGCQLHEPPEKEMAPLKLLHKIHHVKHGLITAETAMTLAVHRLLSLIQHVDSPGQATDKASKAVFYLSKASTSVNIALYTSSPSSFDVHSLSIPWPCLITILSCILHWGRDVWAFGIYANMFSQYGYFAWC